MNAFESKPHNFNCCQLRGALVKVIAQISKFEINRSLQGVNETKLENNDTHN